MSISTFERNASIAEMAVEMDRRGNVIEKLEADLATFIASNGGLTNEVLSLRDQLSRSQEFLRQAREVLGPFAKVAEHDIGVDEADSDHFRPMYRHNRAPLITVGDLRSASRALAGGEHE